MIGADGDIIDDWRPPSSAAPTTYEDPIDPVQWNDTLVQQSWHLPAGARVMEVGCSTGFFSVHLTARGCEVVGCELDPEALARARERGVTAHRLDVTDGADRAELLRRCGGRRFDVVLFGDVLEHLADPAAALVGIRTLLRPGGRVVASIPNVGHGSVRLDLLRGRFRYDASGLLDRTHIQLFTLERVREVLADAGFRIERLSRVVQPIEGTEGRIAPGDLDPRLVELVGTDPESWVYQYVVLARPTGLRHATSRRAEPAAADIVIVRVGDRHGDDAEGLWADALPGDGRMAVVTVQDERDAARVAATLPPDTSVLVTDGDVLPDPAWVQAVLDGARRHGAAGAALVGFDDRVVHAGADASGRPRLRGLAVPSPMLDTDVTAGLLPPYVAPAGLVATGSRPIGMVVGEAWATAPRATAAVADRWAQWRAALGRVVFVVLPGGPAVLPVPARRNLLRLADLARGTGCTLVTHWGEGDVGAHRGAAVALQRAGVVCFGGHAPVDCGAADGDPRCIDPATVARQLDIVLYADARSEPVTGEHDRQVTVELAAMPDALFDVVARLCATDAGSGRAADGPAPLALLCGTGCEPTDLDAPWARPLVAAGWRVEGIVCDEPLEAVLESRPEAPDVVIVLDGAIAVPPDAVDVPVVRRTSAQRAQHDADLLWSTGDDGLVDALAGGAGPVTVDELAVAAIERLLDDGACYRSRLRHGARHLDRGATVAAAEQFLAAARLDPRLPQAWNGLGMACFAEGDLRAARRAFAAARRAAPAYPAATDNLAAVDAALACEPGVAPPATSARRCGAVRASIVIPVWNAWAHTRACLVRLAATIEPEDEVIVVDNGSTDGTRRGLDAFPWVRVERLTRNLGFGGGCNAGAEVAGGDVLVFLNNDTLPAHDWLERLLRPFADPAVAASGPRSNFVSGAQSVPATTYAGGGDAALDAFVRRWERAHDGAVDEVERLVGFCLAVDAARFAALGGFDTRFGIGSYEDDDLCRRLRHDAGRLVVVHDSFVHHHGHATFTANDVDWVALERRNRTIYDAKHAA
ncbi:MAG: glycosyltransferase [Acidimicrobiales bacterium]|nr:glycosyltransferase [Acidimicrobiales bacterium]